MIEFDKLSVHQLAILSKSRLIQEIVSTLDEKLVLKKGVLGNIVEECKVESSACIGLDDMEKRSLIKKRNRVGDKIQPCGIPSIG